MRLQTRRLLTASTRHDEEMVLAHSSAVPTFGPALEAGAPGTARPASGARGGSAGRGRWGQRLTLSSQRNPNWGRTQTMEDLPVEKPLEGSYFHPCTSSQLLVPHLHVTTLTEAMSGLDGQ